MFVSLRFAWLACLLALDHAGRIVVRPPIRHTLIKCDRLCRQSPHVASGCRYDIKRLGRPDSPERKELTEQIGGDMRVIGRFCLDMCVPSPENAVSCEPNEQAELVDLEMVEGEVNENDEGQAVDDDLHVVPSMASGSQIDVPQDPDLDDEGRLAEMEARLSMESGADARNVETFGDDAAAGSGGWSFEEALEANAKLQRFPSPVSEVSPRTPARSAAVPRSPAAPSKPSVHGGTFLSDYEAEMDRITSGEPTPEMTIAERVGNAIVADPDIHIDQNALSEVVDVVLKCANGPQSTASRSTARDVCCLKHCFAERFDGFDRVTKASCIKSCVKAA